MQAWGVWGLKLLTAAKFDPGYINSLISLGKCQGYCVIEGFCQVILVKMNVIIYNAFCHLDTSKPLFFGLSKGLHICHMYMVTVPLCCMLLVCKLHFTFLLLWKNSNCPIDTWGARFVTGSTRIYRRNITCKAKHSHNVCSALARIQSLTTFLSNFAVLELEHYAASFTSL